MNQRANVHRRAVPAALVGALALGALAPSVARAAGDADGAAANKAAAQALLLQGNSLLEKGKAADALEKFTEARRQFPSPKIYYNIGQAEGLLPGHEAQSYEAMSRFLNEAKDANPALRAAAETQRQASRTKVGLVFVTAEPTASEVMVDDANVGPPSADMPLVLSIGAHRLALRKDHATSAAETITVAGGETFKLQLRLPPAIALAPAPIPPPVGTAPTPSAAVAATITAPASPPVPADASARDGWRWQRVTGASLLGLGAASLALGVIEHLRYFGKADDFRNAGCGTANLTGDCAGLKSQFDSAHTWFIAGYVGAAVLGGAGAYLLWIAPTAPAGATETRSVGSAGQGPTAGLTVGLQGHF